VELYQAAAEQGNADAQYALGKCYANGTGIGKNVEKAEELYRAAAKQEHANAKSKLDELERQKAEITAAEDRVKEEKAKEEQWWKEATEILEEELSSLTIPQLLYELSKSYALKRNYERHIKLLEEAV